MITLEDRIAVHTADLGERAWIMALVSTEAPKLAARLLDSAVAALPQAEAGAVHEYLMAPPLTPEVAAKIARCSRKTLDGALRRGEVLSAKGSTGLRVIDRASLETWARARFPKVFQASPVDRRASRPKMKA